MSDPYAAIRPLVKELAHLLEWGCSDGSCRLVKRQRGMVTNGGCKCLEYLADLSLRVAAATEPVQRYISAPIIDKTPNAKDAK